MNPVARRHLITDLENAVHRLATLQAVDKLLSGSPTSFEPLIDELRKALIATRRIVHNLRAQLDPVE